MSKSVKTSLPKPTGNGESDNVPKPISPIVPIIKLTPPSSEEAEEIEVGDNNEITIRRMSQYMEPEPDVDFPNYIKYHGIELGLTRALTALYEEPIKPENPLLYVCQQMGYGLLPQEKIDEVEAQVADLRAKVEELEVENEELRNILSPEEDEVKKIDIFEDDDIRDLLQREFDDLELVHIRKVVGHIDDDTDTTGDAHEKSSRETPGTGESLEYGEFEGEYGGAYMDIAPSSPGSAGTGISGLPLLKVPVNSAVDEESAEVNESGSDAPETDVTSTSGGRKAGLAIKRKKSAKVKSRSSINRQ